MQQGRLDYFIISENLIQCTASAKIEPGYRSDHSLITLELESESQSDQNQRTRTYWKFNNSLLKDINYVKEVIKVISNTKKQYALPVYNREEIDSIDDNTIEFLIDDALFFDTLLMEIRGKTIAYSSYKKKEKDKEERDLIKEIEDIEKQIKDDSDVDLLEVKKEQLRSIRKTKIDGMIIRSRAQWSLEGERNSRYFCNLEKRHYTDKNMSTLETDNGQIINNQTKIKEEVQLFYGNLYKSKEHCTTNVNLSTTIVGPRLTQVEREQTEGLISVEEAGKILKQMKNGKSPGLDGFTTEFFKFFWKNLSILLVRSINYGFQKGEMSITQRRGVITCIPKENKPKRFIKNWRPITLLNTTYKIASACIAERIKGILPKIIGEEQKGFLTGRYIGENLRMIYDVLAFTETHKLSGILMLIDFEKAFDSISWSFIRKSLEFFGFGPDIQNWVNIFYKDISACVAINGNYTGWFQIQRGVRQGDPLSPYLYLISAEILSLMIKKNKQIKGIKLDDTTEALLSQFADDTSLFLDGTEECFESCVRCVEEFTAMSGLRMNFEKTQIVWIGSKKNSNVRYMRDKNFIWNPGIFKVLGINFSVNIEEIVSLNYKNKLKEIEGLFKLWSRRHLTPFGKITVIKSLALSKIVHLLINLPDPNKDLLKQLKKTFYQFLWDGKNGKLNKELSYAEYHEGGLKMVDLDSFLAAMKIGWLKRLEEAPEDSFMKKMTRLTNSYIPELPTRGNDFAFTLLNELCNKNNFWFDVIKHYRRAYSKCKPETANEFLAERIHYNVNLKKPNKNFNSNNWILNDVLAIGDIIDDNGTFLNLETFNAKFPGIITNNTEYNQLINSIKEYMMKINVTLDQNNRKEELPRFWRILLSGGSKAVYCILKYSNKKKRLL